MKELKLSLQTAKAKFKRATPFINKHGSFMAVLAVLVIYLFVVWHISSLATAEPSNSDLSAAESSSAVPKIDNNAIKQIQNLEQNSTQVQALFDQARNNPFHE